MFMAIAFRTEAPLWPQSAMSDRRTHYQGRSTFNDLADLAGARANVKGLDARKKTTRRFRASPA
jgi:hypothetical protein